MQLCRTCNSTGSFPAVLAACCASRARLAALLKLSELALRLLTMPDAVTIPLAVTCQLLQPQLGFLSALGFKMLKLSVTVQQPGHCLLPHSARSEHEKQQWPASTIMAPWCVRNHGLGRAGQRGCLRNHDV